MKIFLLLLVTVCMTLAGCRHNQPADRNETPPSTSNVQVAGADTASSPAAVTKASNIRWKSYTTNVNYNLDELKGSHSVQLTGELLLEETDEVLAIAPARILEANDEQNRPLLGHVAPSIPREVVRAFRIEEMPPDPKFTGYYPREATRQVTVKLDGLQRLPEKISHLAGQVHVLLATEKDQKELTLEEAASSSEVAPGLTVSLTPESLRQLAQAGDAPKTSTSPRQVQVSLQWSKTLQENRYDYSAMLQAPSIMTFDLVDQDDRLMTLQNRSPNYRPLGNGQIQFSLNAYVSVHPGQTVKAVRLTILKATQIKTIAFELKDIPVR